MYFLLSVDTSLSSGRFVPLPLLTRPLRLLISSYSGIFAVKVEVPITAPSRPRRRRLREGPLWLSVDSTTFLGVLPWPLPAWPEMNQVGVGTQRAGGQRGRGNEVERTGWWPEGKRRLGEFCFGGVNILELVPVVQKVMPLVCKHQCVSVGFLGPSCVCMCMHVYTSVCLIVSYFLYGIFTTMAVVDSVFIRGELQSISFFSILLL